MNTFLKLRFFNLILSVSHHSNFFKLKLQFLYKKHYPEIRVFKIAMDMFKCILQV